MDEEEDFERVKRLLRTCADAGKGLDAGAEARTAAHDLARLGAPTRRLRPRGLAASPRLTQIAWGGASAKRGNPGL